MLPAGQLAHRQHLTPPRASRQHRQSPHCTACQQPACALPAQPRLRRSQLHSPALTAQPVCALPAQGRLRRRHSRHQPGASSVELPPEEFVPPAGRIESTRLDGKVRQQVEDAVEALGRRVTVGDVASRAGVSLAQAEEALNALAADSAGSLEVSQAGEVLYTLPGNFKAIIRGRSWVLRSQPAFRAVSNAGGYLVRVAFGAALLASVTVVWTAILAVMSSSNNSDDRRSQRGGGGGGTVIYMNSYMFQDLSYLFWYGSPRYDRMQQRRGRKGQMGFLESIFSFVFGDGNPNLDFEERRWKLVGELISRSGGVVTAEQLAPYLDQSGSSSEGGALNEDFVVPALVRFGGSPEVDAAGNLLYRFPSLQSMGGQTQGRREKLEVAALERPWQLSKAKGAQKWGALALGIANLVGVLVLQGLLASRGVQYSQYGELAAALATPLFFLKLYAFSFFLIPALRWLSVAAKNRAIDARNDSRTQAARALAAPTRSLQQKLARAKEQSRQTVVSDRDIIYSSAKGNENVDTAAEDFDRRLRASDGSDDSLSEARLVWDQKRKQQQQQPRGW